MKKQPVHYKYRKFSRKRYTYKDLYFDDDRDDSGAYPTWLDYRSWHYTRSMRVGFRVVRNKQ